MPASGGGQASVGEVAIGISIRQVLVGPLFGWRPTLVPSKGGGGVDLFSQLPSMDTFGGLGQGPGVRSVGLEPLGASVLPSRSPKSARHIPGAGPGIDVVYDIARVGV